ncbi:MAG: RNHCP domain-containing protein [Bacilli bacterium]|jgi:ribosome biogenesis GTPase
MNEFTHKKPKFTMIDEAFKCNVCGTKVEPLEYTARDHCLKCLCSKHVDNNPGDRANKCHGVLKPIAIEPHKNDNYKIVYRCTKCGIIKRNKAANNDNFNLMLKIMSNPESL